MDYLLRTCEKSLPKEAANPYAAGERGGNNLSGFRTENGSSQGQNLAFTGLCVPRSLDSGISPDFFQISYENEIKLKSFWQSSLRHEWSNTTSKNHAVL